MKSLALFILIGLSRVVSFGQNTIYSYSVGNWIDGPVVYLAPVIETTEAFTTPQLIEQLKRAHEEFVGIKDIDVLRFATHEEAVESRRILHAKYLLRPLEVVLLGDHGTVEASPRSDE